MHDDPADVDGLDPRERRALALLASTGPTTESAPGDGVEEEARLRDLLGAGGPDDAAGVPALEAALAELGVDLASARVDPARLSPHVKAAVLDRLQTPAAGRSERTAPEAPPTEGRARSVRPPLRALRRPPLFRHPRRVAALGLLLGVGLVAWLVAGLATAAGVRVEGIDRIRLQADAPIEESGRLLTPGERVVARADELVALRLSGGGAVVLAGGTGVDVVRLPWAGRDASLRLVDGAVRMHSPGVPVDMALGQGLVFELLRGEACAVHTAGSPTVALPAGARALVLRSRDAPEPVEGPTTLRLPPAGPSALEADVRVLGSCTSLEEVLPERGLGDRGRVVEASRWRVVSGRATRRGEHLELGPAAGTHRARIAWRPGGDVRDAVGMLVRVSAPRGVTVRLGPAPLSGDAPAPGSPGPLAFSLPGGWVDALAGREIVLTFDWPEAAPGAPLSFDGTVFLPDAWSG